MPAPERTMNWFTRFQRTPGVRHATVSTSPIRPITEAGLRASFGSEGRRLALAEFDLHAMLAALTSLYEDMLDAHGGTAAAGVQQEV